MDGMVSRKDYAATVDVVCRLKCELFDLADQRGTLDPDVIALSQTIDRYIVLIQNYWKRQDYRVS